MVHEEWYQQRRDAILQALLAGQVDATAATRHLVALRRELLRVRQLHQTFGAVVAQAVRDSVEVPVAAAEEPPVCASCGASGAALVLPVFEVRQRRQADWPLCAPCWRHLTIGFATLRPGEDVARYGAAAAFPLTDVEVRSHIAAGRRAVGRTPKPA